MGKKSERLSEKLKIKAGILCLGIKGNVTSEKMHLLQHPHSHKRTGNSGIQIDLGDKLVVNAICNEKFCEKSPYSIKKVNHNFWLCLNDSPLTKIGLIKPPGGTMPASKGI